MQQVPGMKDRSDRQVMLKNAALLDQLGETTVERLDFITNGAVPTGEPLRCVHS